MHILLLLFKSTLALGIAIICGAVLILSGAYLYLSPNVPSIESLKRVELQLPLRVYSKDGKLIREFGEMRRSPISIAQVPSDFTNALLSAEDDNFTKHHGVDPGSLLRAAAQLAKTRKIQTGGSTITMQVAKNFFLTSERSFSRKANEILLALQIERELSKEEILELYINKIYLGHRAYGIEAAANVYYGKSIHELDLPQLAMIAGLPKAPSRFNPLVNPVRSLERRDWILGRMFKLGHIDQQRYDTAVNTPETAKLHINLPELDAPYIAEMARLEMVERYGSDAYTLGLDVVTSIPSQLQESAQAAVIRGLRDYDRRHGYRGPESNIADSTQWKSVLSETRPIQQFLPAIVSKIGTDHIEVLLTHGQQERVAWSSMTWAARFLSNSSRAASPRNPASVVRVGDLIRVQRNAKDELEFSQLPKIQGALVSLDPHNGAIRALVGGLSFDHSHYNRATQAQRQPGSSFKPFIYSAALDAGYTAATIVDDGPLEIFEPGMKKAWRPKNANNTFLGPIRIREGLFRSRNLVSIRVLRDIGIPYARDYISKFGLKAADLPPNLSLALGSATLVPLDMTAAWAVFANGGYRVTPYLVEEIRERDGNLVFKANPHMTPEGKRQSGLEEAQTAESVIDPRTAYLITDMLKDVVQRGTAQKARSLGRNDLAGKTGTTNDAVDSWFIGYNYKVLTSVWAGFDQPETLGKREFGATISLPIWVDYMKSALDGMPSSSQPQPKGMVSLRVNRYNGRLAAPGSPDAYMEIFKEEDTPLTTNVFPDGDDFFQPQYPEGTLKQTPQDKLFDLF